MNTLRHSFASLLIHEGRSVNYVQAALGHSTPDLTLGTYSHLFDESQLGRGVKMVDAIKEARGPLPAHLLLRASPSGRAKFEAEEKRRAEVESEQREYLAGF